VRLDRVPQIMRYDAIMPVIRSPAGRLVLKITTSEFREQGAQTALSRDGTRA